MKIQVDSMFWGGVVFFFSTHIATHHNSLKGSCHTLICTHHPSSCVLLGDVWICADKHGSHMEGESLGSRNAVTWWIIMCWQASINKCTEAQQALLLTHIKCRIHTCTNIPPDECVLYACICAYCMSTSSVPVAWFVAWAFCFCPVNTFYWVTLILQVYQVQSMRQKDRNGEKYPFDCSCWNKNQYCTKGA